MRNGLDLCGFIPNLSSWCIELKILVDVVRLPKKLMKDEWVIGFTSVQNTCKVPIFFFNINFPALKLMIIINNKVCVFMKPIMIIENKIKKIHETTLQEILYIILFTFINY